jgi:hypothetical protein
LIVKVENSRINKNNTANTKDKLYLKNEIEWCLLKIINRKNTKKKTSEASTVKSNLRSLKYRKTRVTTPKANPNLIKS